MSYIWPLVVSVAARRLLQQAPLEEPENRRLLVRGDPRARDAA